MTSAPEAGWVITGFQTVLGLWGWSALVLLHAAWRSFQGVEADPLRSSGPID